MYNIPVEVWKDIAGYEGYYQISNFGRVKSLQRLSRCRNNKYRTIKEKVLKCSTDSDGYKQIYLCNGKTKVRRKVHHLVLEAFDRKRKENEECRHLDGIRANNWTWNLKWGTVKENHLDMVRHGNSTRGEKSTNTSLKEGEVLLMKKILEAKIVTQRFIAKIFKVSNQCVTDIKLGRRWGWLCD